jgi:hypothetical protein
VNAAERAGLIAAAKRKAIPVASCVAASLRPDHLFADVAPEDLEGLLKALVVVLAAAADPVTLRAVVATPDDGHPDPASRDLKAAHAECNRLRKAGLPIPTRVRLLEAQYQRQVRQVPGPSGVLGQVISDAAKRQHAA